MAALGHPSSTAQTKDRLYTQLAHNIARMSRAVGQTCDMFEHLQADLESMRVLAALHAAQ
jgi:hypothetical protein